MNEKKSLRVLKVTQYKGFHVLIQQIIKTHLFQFIIFDPTDSKFYQGFNIITPKRGKNKQHTDEDLVGITGVMLDYAFTTVEALTSKESEQLEQNAQGAAVLDILEKADKAEKKKGKKLVN